MTTETQAEILTVPEAAAARRSIRSYRQEPIPQEDLERILDVVRTAPSAFNAQPWRFVVATDPALRARLAEAANGQRQVTGAPAVIVLYTDMRDVLERVEDVVHPGIPAERRAATADGFRRIWSGKADAEREQWGAGQGYIALGYLLLAATSYGYGTSPMLGFDPEKVKQALGLPAHVAVPAMVAIGRPDEEGFTHHRHPLERIVSWR